MTDGLSDPIKVVRGRKGEGGKKQRRLGMEEVGGFLHSIKVSYALITYM